MTQQRRLTARFHCNRFTGYGEMVCQLFEWLTKFGIYVSVRPLAVDEQWGKASSIPMQMRAQMVNSRQPEPWELLMAPPNNPPTPGRKTVMFSMYESTELPRPMVHNLNQCALVIVPCDWCRESFIESGVNVPIEVIPLGYDPAVFQPTPMRMDGPTVFGVAGRTKHCARRKSVQEGIDLFLKTFAQDEDVRLHVKVHPDDIAEAKDHRVKISKSHFEPYELAHWLSGLTAFMTLSRAEGFGLWPLQAMACGRPVLGMKYAGQAGFLSEANSYVIPHREVEPQSGLSNVIYLGMWAEPKLKEAGQLMQRVRSNRAEAAVIGAAGQKWIRDWTWERSATQLVKVLEEVGAL
jgi:glycosyltransferase involved in cell wall biosynthesis